MRPATRTLALLAGAALLGACATAGPTASEPPAAQEAGTRSDTETAAAARALPPPGGANARADDPAAADAVPAHAATPDTRPRPSAPHIYLALQPGGTGRPTSAVFAIDAARDGTPSDDPAIRLTPEAGRCNPQEMRRYAFPDGAAPVAGEAEAAQGLTARDLPRFLAAAVTGRLIAAGLAAEPEDTRPLNICTRKLWERLVVAENRGRLAAE